jgi:Mn2+/Fe2+ NRAMP family transporter
VIDDSSLWLARYILWLMDFAFVCVIIFYFRKATGRGQTVLNFSQEMLGMFAFMSVLKLVLQKLGEG